MIGESPGEVWNVSRREWRHSWRVLKHLLESVETSPGKLWNISWRGLRHSLESFETYPRGSQKTLKGYVNALTKHHSRKHHRYIILKPLLILSRYIIHTLNLWVGCLYSGSNDHIDIHVTGASLGPVQLRHSEAFPSWAGYMLGGHLRLLQSGKHFQLRNIMTMKQQPIFKSKTTNELVGNCKSFLVTGFSNYNSLKFGEV